MLKNCIYSLKHFGCKRLSELTEESAGGFIFVFSANGIYVNQENDRR